MWLDQQVSLYSCPADNIGTVATFREVLMSRFAIEHEWYYKIYPDDKVAYPKGKWISGKANDLETMIAIRTGQIEKSLQVQMKQTMQCFTPAALFATKKQSEIKELCKTGLMQLDFDYKDIQDYDIEELKRLVFSLPYTAFCGKSCSGAGFYALLLLAEPDKLAQYAEHTFQVLNDYGIKADTTKGSNANDLRFVSYDCNMLIRENPEPFVVKHFRTKPKPKQSTAALNYSTSTDNSALVKASLKKITDVMQGERWDIVQKVATTLGGLNNYDLLNQLKRAIASNSAFSGEENKYFKCAEDCFAYGTTKPLIAK
jgi:hypothetical protein